MGKLKLEEVNSSRYPCRDCLVISRCEDLCEKLSQDGFEIMRSLEHDICPDCSYSNLELKTVDQVNRESKIYDCKDCGHSFVMSKYKILLDGNIFGHLWLLHERSPANDKKEKGVYIYPDFVLVPSNKPQEIKLRDEDYIDLDDFYYLSSDFGLEFDLQRERQLVRKLREQNDSQLLLFDLSECSRIDFIREYLGDNELIGE